MQAAIKKYVLRMVTICFIKLCKYSKYLASPGAISNNQQADIYSLPHEISYF